MNELGPYISIQVHLKTVWHEKSKLEKSRGMNFFSKLISLSVTQFPCLKNAGNSTHILRLVCIICYRMMPERLGFPGGSVVENLPAKCRRHRFDPTSIETTKPMCHNY